MIYVCIQRFFSPAKKDCRLKQPPRTAFGGAEIRASAAPSTKVLMPQQQQQQQAIAPMTLLVVLLLLLEHELNHRAVAARCLP